MKAIFANSLDVMIDADFEETAHPRDKGGKFTLKPGQSTEQAHKGPNGEWNKPSKDLHNDIISKALEGKKKRKGEKPTAYLLGGGSASGKSTSFNSMYAEKFRDELVKIDSDAIKKLLPEFEELKKRDPDHAAALVHEESSHIAKQMMALASAKKLDLIYDSTGAGNGIQGLAKELKHQGYKVNLMYFDIPTKLARQRADERANNPKSESYGRHIPEEVLQYSHQGSARNFVAMHQGKYIDSMKLFDNTEKIPALVYSQEGAKPGIVVEANKWKEYKKKGGAE